MLRFLILATLLCATAHIPALAKPFDSATAIQIDADVGAVLERTGTPSAVVAIIQDDRVIYRKAYGLRDRERRLAANVDTFYEIGSITKQFTAAAILQLQEAGKLDIDDKVSKYLPDAPHASELTLRQLLSHTSGLPEYFDGPGIEQEATKPTTFAQLMARVDGKPLVFAPGSKMTYNNTGYVILGRVIELVSHEVYRDYVRVHLIDRADMKRTHNVSNEPQLANMAVGYEVKDGIVRRAPTIHDSFGWSAGNLVSTLDDLAKWSRALAHAKIVSESSYRQMTTPTRISQGTSNYGLGLFVDSIRGQPRIGHTGGTFGFATANEFFPKQNVRIIAFTNCIANPEPGEMITSALFDDLFPEIAAAADEPAPGEDPEVTTKAKRFFEGLQRGSPDHSELAPKLAQKMTDGLAQRLAGVFAPFGAAKRLIYKGLRLENGLHWYDYVIDFGPGSQLKFSIGLDEGAMIASISYG